MKHKIKFRNFWIWFKDQVSRKRFFYNFFISRNAWGAFSINSHINQHTGKPKVTYNTFASAQKAADAMSKKRNAHFSVYKCLFCDGYHIGKNRDNKIEGYDYVREYTIAFFSKDNKWYADIPNHTLEDNEMVFGSDVLLDAISQGKYKVSITCTTLPSKNESIIELTRKTHDNDGAEYTISKIDEAFDDDLGGIWICNVAHDVFGDHPANIYIINIERNN